mmetsp:Transcript_33801/g.84232  ORF Transcript_33801/g.84232 Transcript_33801/m.84232 type:complete len:207 (+) Transcript_33801:684-1304(+)
MDLTASVRVNCAFEGDVVVGADVVYQARLLERFHATNEFGPIPRRGVSRAGTHPLTLLTAPERLVGVEGQSVWLVGERATNRSADLRKHREPIALGECVVALLARPQLPAHCEGRPVALSRRWRPGGQGGARGEVAPPRGVVAVYVGKHKRGLAVAEQQADREADRDTERAAAPRSAVAGLRAEDVEQLFVFLLNVVHLAGRAELA